MKSIAIKTNNIVLPFITGEHSMIKFNLDTFVGLSGVFLSVAKQMIKGINHNGGTAFFTIHGKKLKAGETLRRGSPHTDGNYEPVSMNFGVGGGNGWKVGENGPAIDTKLHERQYLSTNGGIVIASNFESCLGWTGEFIGEPSVGGDCRHIKLNTSFMLQKNKIYYGNNHFIHESLPLSSGFHRVFARITMPENHIFQG